MFINCDYCPYQDDCNPYMVYYCDIINKRLAKTKIKGEVWGFYDFEKKKVQRL